MDHLGLLESAAALLAPRGRIWFGCSARSFRPEQNELQAALSRNFPGARVRDISGQTIDEDFRGRKTPKAFAIEIGPSS